MSASNGEWVPMAATWGWGCLVLVLCCCLTAVASTAEPSLWTGLLFPTSPGIQSMQTGTIQNPAAEDPGEAPQLISEQGEGNGLLQRAVCNPARCWMAEQSRTKLPCHEKLDLVVSRFGSVSCGNQCLLTPALDSVCPHGAAEPAPAPWGMGRWCVH